MTSAERGAEQARRPGRRRASEQAVEVAGHARRRDATVRARRAPRRAVGRPRARSACCCSRARSSGFILRDQAEDLLRAPGVVAVEPPRVPYGALAPPARAASATRSANGGAGGWSRRCAATATDAKVVVIFHPSSTRWRAAIAGARAGDCELWYGRWDRYEHAYDAGPHLRERLAELHEAAGARCRR